jgi:putative ABC transport system permease protein
MNLRRIALGSVRRRKTRAAFLVAGLAIGVATVVALLTLGSALRVEAQDSLEQFGANIVLVPRSDRIALSYGGADLGGVDAGAREIREADLARIDTIPNRENIAIVAPELLGVVKADGREALLMGVRVDDEFELKKWWSLAGDRPEGEDQLVAGSAVARRLGLELGDTVDVDGRRFTVSGLLAPTGSQDDDLLITGLPVAQKMLDKTGLVTLVQVAALCANCPVDEIASQLSAALPKTDPTVMQQVVRSRMHALDQFRTFAYAIAAVIVAIEIMVVFVTMLGSVNARTREIGVFRALGFRRGHVTGLILIEAMLASTIAGLLGYLGGMAASYVVAPLVADGAVTIAWTPALAAGAVAIALAVGSVASLYPALHASRLDPTVALRAL